MYKHGTYGEMETSGIVKSTSGTLPVYVGTAPIHYVGEEFEGKVNRPLLITSLQDAKNKIGYSEDFDKYTLCEAVYAHFNNTIQAIGPIAVINVFDPDNMQEKETQEDVILTDGIAFLEGDILLSSIQIQEKTAGTDYRAEYVGEKVKVTTITPMESPITVTYTRLTPNTVGEQEIIGAITSSGAKTGICAVDYVYHIYDMIPSILLAPKWSASKPVADALVERCVKINGKWDCVACTDIDSTDVDTISKAITYKKEQALNSEKLKLCYPMVKMGEKLIHLSTVTAVTMQIVDKEANNVPYISPSNKKIDVTGTFLNQEKDVIYDFEQANLLNEKGITTAIYYGGGFKLWGPHMANYNYNETDIQAGKIADSNIRMHLYLYNEFQKKFLSRIDGAMNRRAIDNILDESKIWLNGLVSDGKILKGEITFSASDNKEADVAVGDFVFDVAFTGTPNTKSVTFRIRQTTDGTELLFGGEE